MNMAAVVGSSASLLLLSNVLSISVILACIVIKLPQILSMIRGGSSKGVRLSSVLLEECGYSIMLTYHFAMNYPIATYFEYTFLVLQDLIVIVLILGYNEKLNLTALPFFALYMCVFSCFAMNMVPGYVLKTAISLCTPISTSSKLIQLVSIVRNQDPGTVSAATWGMAFYTTMARSITTLIQTGDVRVLINFGISCLLNFSLTIMVLYYRRSSKKKLY
ncbi:hypothetical protein SNE40_005000 [Patella caerulea]|uniref:Solute carrier family 66 member 3 n=2 Tax=Patella caerulea TaxID=87958 RepID=A0AAN8K476_PATCE